MKSQLINSIILSLSVALMMNLGLNPANATQKIHQQHQENKKCEEHKNHKECKGHEGHKNHVTAN